MRCSGPPRRGTLIRAPWDKALRDRFADSCVDRALPLARPFGARYVAAGVGAPRPEDQHIGLHEHAVPGRTLVSSHRLGTPRSADHDGHFTTGRSGSRFGVVSRRPEIGLLALCGLYLVARSRSGFSTGRPSAADRQSQRSREAHGSALDEAGTSRAKRAGSPLYRPLRWNCSKERLLVTRSNA